MYIHIMWQEGSWPPLTPNSWLDCQCLLWVEWWCLVCLHFTGNMVDLVICHLTTTIINTLNQGEPLPLPYTHTHRYSCLHLIVLLPTDKHQDPRWSSLPLPLLEMLLSGRFEGHVEENTKKVSHHCVSDDRRGCCFIVHISPSLTGANLSAVPPSEQDPDECEQLQRKCIHYKSLGVLTSLFTWLMFLKCSM